MWAIFAKDTFSKKAILELEPSERWPLLPQYPLSEAGEATIRKLSFR